MYCLYRWVDCLNVELATARRMPTIAPPQNDTILYDSDEDVVFECMNKTNLITHGHAKMHTHGFNK